MMRDRYRGCMLGLAIGDALGQPVEFLHGQDRLDAFGPEGVGGFEAGRFPAGSYTDDTQMSMALAEGILSAGPGAALGDVMAGVGTEFVQWESQPEGGHRAPGNTCLTGCRNYASGTHWRESGVAESKGCGSAMRAAPIGLAWPDDDGQISEVGIASSVITHGHPCALAGAVGMAALVSMALADADVEEMYDRVFALTDEISVEFTDRLSTVPEALKLPTAEAWELLGEGWVAEEAVAGALYSFWRTPDDYAATVLHAANTDGDSDSLACMAGAISGAYNGERAIPEEWRADVENATALMDIADRLCEYAGCG